ncbi:MAG TPA: AI-2E family transporter [Roseiflexaceae bacterium]|nr:AI-2E family transporter [Roseiflexaceae bacterium]
MAPGLSQRIAIWLVIIAVSIFLIERLFVVVSFFASTLLMFAIAWLIALVLQPIVNWMTSLPLPQRRFSRRASIAASASTPRYLSRIAAVVIIYVALIAFVSTLTISLVPLLTVQIANLTISLPETVNTLTVWISELENDLSRIGGSNGIGSMIQPETLAQQIASFGSTAIQQSLGIVGSIAALLFNIFIVLILSFYMTADGPQIAVRIVGIMPANWRDEVEMFFSIVDRTFGGFLRAQLLNSLIYACATAIAMAVFGLGNIAFVAVVSAILVFIPLVGGYLALIAPALIALVDAPDRILLIVVVLLIIQQLQFNLLTPRLVGQIIGLHPLLVFAALLLGGTVAGGWGILFGIPVAGVLASVAHFVYLRANHLTIPAAK